MKRMNFQSSTIGHWLLEDPRAQVGLAIGASAVIILLSTSPVASTFTRTCNRMIGQLTTKKEKTNSLEREQGGGVNKTPSQHSKSRAETKTMVKDDAHAPAPPPKLPSKDHLPQTTAGEPEEPQTPDNASISSEGSSERSHKQRKLRVGKNLKRAWQNRPFGHASEAPTSPK